MKNPIVLIVLGALAAFAIIVVITISFQAGKQSTKPPASPVPVAITYRRSLAGNGYVFRFTDTATTEVFFTVTVRNSTIWKQYRLDLRPDQFKEIGVLQGWQAFPGDSCTVDAGGFTEVNGQIPANIN